MMGMIDFRETRKKNTLVLVVLLCFIVPNWAAPTSQLELQCNSGEYLSANKTFCCNKCLPGQKLKSECLAGNLRSECVECDKGTYTDAKNYVPNCRQCRRCKSNNNEEEVVECSTERNRVCQCKRGFFRDNIDSISFQCLQCKTCGVGERQAGECTQEKDTACECKHDYHKSNNGCLPCANCTDVCEHHCEPVTKPTKRQDDFLTGALSWIVLAVLVMLALFGVFAVSYCATKLAKKEPKLKDSLPASEISSEDSTKALIHGEGPYPEMDQAVPSLGQMRVCEHERPSQLPDCVPPEIKVSDLIYSVLELVSVSHVKQLVRCLGVSERRIEEAERDHRVCREAHYQMLRIWAEGSGTPTGRGGGGGVLHRPLLQDLLDKLRGINLGGPAQELEEKYGVQ